MKLGFELTILCATRTSETLRDAWTEVDLAAKTWTIPVDRMKGGVDHRIPLSPRCVEILTRAQALSDGSQYVFPAADAAQRRDDAWVSVELS